MTAEVLTLLKPSELNRVLIAMTRASDNAGSELARVMTKDVDDLTFQDLSVIADSMALDGDAHTILRSRIGKEVSHA